MDKIQVVFLFVSTKQLNKSAREKIKEIVRREYGRIYGIGQQSVEIMLEDGICPSHPSEIVLVIKKRNNKINEAAYRAELASAVAKELSFMRELRDLHFQGNVSCQDGLAETHENTPVPKEAVSFPEIIATLLPAVVIAVLIITLDVILGAFKEFKKENADAGVVVEVQDLISAAMNGATPEANKISLTKLRKMAGKKGKAVAPVKDGKIVKEKLTIISSDQEDQETHALMDKNGGVLLVDLKN